MSKRRRPVGATPPPKPEPPKNPDLVATQQSLQRAAGATNALVQMMNEVVAADLEDPIHAPCLIAAAHQQSEVVTELLEAVKRQQTFAVRWGISQRMQAQAKEAAAAARDGEGGDAE